MNVCVTLFMHTFSKQRNKNGYLLTSAFERIFSFPTDFPIARKKTGLQKNYSSLKKT